uniref:Uncharacterized protein n=1 Tax=Avena sativa TaxID=4498 RepID=A0ACD5YIV8_AVESA
MAPGKTPSLQITKPNQAALEPHHELLVAARQGDWRRLELLLSKQDDTPPREVVIHVVEEPVAVDVEASTTAATPATVVRDSVLHVVASQGDGEEFLKSATVIHAKASHLLHARNSDGDTPLHCATRAGGGEMVTRLVALARRGGDGGGDEEAKAILRMRNEQGETVLHEAVRLGDKDMVGRLMSEDSQLARVRSADGPSPLYLAVSLGRDDIARQLYEKDPALSYSGPDGRNALHVAALKGKETTKMVLEWKRDLIKQADRSSRSTPLHLAASKGNGEVISLLLAADPSAAYQADIDGSFPIHVAASADEVKAVSVLLDGGREDCAKLRDGRGRTFLHVAVVEDSLSVVTYICKLQSQTFAWLCAPIGAKTGWFPSLSKKTSRKLASSAMNMQDKDGNTALHLAVEMGNLWIFSPLLENREVMLDLRNNKGQTPFDLSCTTIPAGVHYGLNPTVMIHNLLEEAGAKNGDRFHKKHIAKLDEDKEAKKISESTQTIGIAAVLFATVAFTAAFAPPGGFQPNGTPTLAEHYAFNVFIIANTLALVCAGLSITCLMYAGVSPVDIRTRMSSFIISAIFMTGSARSLGAAFVFGIYVVLAPVAPATAVASCAITALALADAVWSIWAVATVQLMLVKRLGVWASWRLPRAILATLLMQFWPYIVIAFVLVVFKIKRVH